MRTLLYALRRLLLVPVAAVIVSLIVFFAVHALTGDPCLREGRQSDTFHEHCLHQLGLDRPLAVQYLAFVRTIAQGLVSPTLIAGAANSIKLGFFALLITVGVGVGLGAMAAVHQDTWRDRLATSGSLLAVSTPNFVLASLLILATVTWMYQLTGGLLYEDIGWGKVEQVPVPALALGLPPAGIVARITRTAMLDVMRQDFVVAARAKGVGERAVMTRHALRNALLPVASVLGPLATTIITGSLVIENVFGIPGLGKPLVGSLFGRNYVVTVEIMTYYSILVGVANVLADVTYSLLDPRVRY